MAEDLLETVGQVFGPLHGGLALAVVGLVGALLGATTGVVAASVISMGLISLPVMLRNGYNPRIACGVIASSGTLALVVPPSLVLIVVAEQLGGSVSATCMPRRCVPAGWRQLPWPVDDNYLGRLSAGAGPVREAGSTVSRSTFNEG